MKPNSTPTPATESDSGWESISIYTRQDALADHSLIDITDAALHAGYSIPDVAITSGCAASLELLDDQQRIKPEALAALLKQFHAKILAEKATLRDICALPVASHTVWMHIGPNDLGNPCLTIMLPEDY